MKALSLHILETKAFTDILQSVSLFNGWFKAILIEIRHVFWGQIKGWHCTQSNQISICYIKGYPYRMKCTKKPIFSLILVIRFFKEYFEL